MKSTNPVQNRNAVPVVEVDLNNCTKKMTTSSVAPKMIDISQNLSYVPSVPTPISSIVDLETSSNKMTSGYFKYNDTVQNWEVLYDGRRTTDVIESNEYLFGENFIEKYDGIYTVKNGEANQRITNARVKIIGLTKQIKANDDSEEILQCQVSYIVSGKEQIKHFDIHSDNFKNSFNIIRKTIRDIFVLQQRADSLEEYLSLVNQRDVSNNPCLNRKVTAAVIGWNLIDGKEQYLIGDTDFYHEYELMEVVPDKRCTVFSDGFNFRNIGNDHVAEVLWIFAHVPYALKFLIQAHAPVTSVIFLQGRTNLLKTASTSVVANVFNKNRANVAIRLSSTQASLQNQIVALRDNLILIDDFSNTIGSDNTKMIHNAEFIIRTIGDGKFPSKMSIKDLSSLASDQVRGSIVLTGEEALNLDSSSLYRIITLPVTENTFNGAVLKVFQENSHILRQYFSLFIQFLSEYHINIVQEITQTFSKEREFFKQLLEIPRFVDFAAALNQVIHIIENFAYWCQIDPNFVQSWKKTATQALIQTLTAHQEESMETDVVKRFIVALKQSFDTSSSSRLAHDEVTYVNSEKDYIGFKESATNTIWLRFEDAFDLVKKFYIKSGQSWTPMAQTIKEELLRRGISWGTLAKDGKSGNEYLIRAKKGTRKRMLVLDMDKIEQF